MDKSFLAQNRLKIAQTEPKVVFLLGSSNYDELAKQIIEESNNFGKNENITNLLLTVFILKLFTGDIVQESFLDTYLNLTLKTGLNDK